MGDLPDLYSGNVNENIISIFGMPKKDGLAVVKEIIAQTPTTKILLITTSDNQKVVQQVGFIYSCVSKPFDLYCLERHFEYFGKVI